MKLSQITIDQTPVVLSTLAPEFETLMLDEKLIEMCSNVNPKGENPNKAFVFVVFMKIAAYLLSSHKESTYRIIGVLNDKPFEDVGSLTILDVAKQAFEIFTDRELTAFFSSLGQ